jgi:hypothetical protein
MPAGMGALVIGNLSDMVIPDIFHRESILLSFRMDPR